MLGGVRPEHHDIVLPSWSTTPGAVTAMPLRQLLARAVDDDARVPLLLAGRRVGPVAEHPAPADGGDLHAVLSVASEAAIASVEQVVDGDGVVHSPDGDLSTRDYLTRATLTRAFLAHYVAAYLGSTACPLPEELARPLWELTAPDAARWRSLGFFGEAMPLPDHVSWRDRFLLCAGHPPHPLGH